MSYSYLIFHKRSRSNIYFIVLFCTSVCKWFKYSVVSRIVKNKEATEAPVLPPSKTSTALFFCQVTTINCIGPFFYTVIVTLDRIDTKSHPTVLITPIKIDTKLLE